MIRNERGLCLCQPGERIPFGKNIADKFMVLFQPSLLPGGHRIAVKDKGMRAQAIFSFKNRRIFKRRTIICQNHGKEPGISAGSQGVIQEIKNFPDSCSAVTLHKKNEHKRTAAEEKSKEDRGAFTVGAFHYVHFHNGAVRIGGYVLLKVKIRAPIR